MKNRILVIEDNPMVIKSLEFKLNMEGYNVVVADDGRKALAMLNNNTFDLIITDLMLPFITGTQIIEYVKKETPHVPVIVLSTATQEDIITDAFNMGIEDFVTKPFSPNELSLRIKRTLNKVKPS